MRFGPHPGMFRHHAGDNVLAQIRFAHDQGFTAWEQNGMPGQTPAMQEKIGKLLSDLKMKMGVFVGYGSFDKPTFTVKKREFRDEVLAAIKTSIDIAERCGAQYFTVVPGSVDQQYADQEKWNKYGGSRLAEGYQLANAIDLLRECAALLEPKRITMVLEPLNWRTDHGGVFLERSDQAFALCRAVNSPSCKILFDIYHQQITEGNLIPNIDLAWDEIAYFQSGDNPGRKEPGTGEINYSKVFGHIQKKSTEAKREFIIGMEHGNSIKGKEGELALIQVYPKTAL
jgi:hydroxypyruvate isomerase